MKSILLIFISIFAIGCSSVFETNNDQFIEEIIRNPTLVKNLKNAFPDRINDTLIHNAMLENNFLSKLEDDIKRFNSISSCERISRFDSIVGKVVLDYFNKRRNCSNPISGNDIILYSIYKDRLNILDVYLYKFNSHKFKFLRR
jgi:hypothetical protein